MQVFEDCLTRVTKNIEKIENSLLFQHLLDSTSTQIPNDNNIFCCAATCVLLCAELENYFEDISENIIEIAKQKWENPTSKELTKPLISLLSYNEKEYTDNIIFIKETLNLYINFNLDVSKRDEFIQKLSNTISALEIKYSKTIFNSHGAKLDNLKKIYEPLGFPINELRNDQARIFSSLNILDGKRGDFAHKSPIGIQLFNKQQIEIYIIDCKKICELVKDAAIVLCNKQGLVL
jgi:hypothetical protein